MKRRQFLYTLSFGVFEPILPEAKGLLKPESFRSTLAHPALLSYLGDEQEIWEIGATYRRLFPSENHSERLVDAIFSATSISTLPGNQAGLERLEEQIRNDFTHGRTLEINGWYLSVLEARQCALFSILYSST